MQETALLMPHLLKLLQANKNKDCGYKQLSGRVFKGPSVIHHMHIAKTWSTASTGAGARARGDAPDRDPRDVVGQHGGCGVGGATVRQALEANAWLATLPGGSACRVVAYGVAACLPRSSRISVRIHCHTYRECRFEKR